MADVIVNSGPVEAEDQLRHVPREKWRELMLARRRFVEIRFSYDCRCLVQFVNEADEMYASLGFDSAEAMICEGYGLEPAEAAIAVEWLRINPPKDPISYEKVQALAARNQAINAKAPDLLPVGTNQYSDGVGNSKNITKPSNDAEYAIRRLRKDRPDIHARVLAGELTAHAGMVEAGFRKKRPTRKLTMMQRILKMSQSLSELERDELIERLVRERKKTAVSKNQLAMFQ